MAELKSLAKDTAIYGASSIIGKFLNYLLVPVYTISLPASSGGYGVITNMSSVFVSYCRFIRLWRTSLVFRDDAHRDCDGRYTSHSFCISAL